MRAGPTARRPSPSLDATDGATAPRGAKRANWILTVGLVLTSYRRYSAKPGGRVPIRIASATAVVDVRSLDPDGRFKAMRHKTQDLATVIQRGPGVVRRSLSRRSPVIGSERSRQGANRAEDSRTDPVPNGPSDPRFSYLTRSFD